MSTKKEKIQLLKNPMEFRESWKWLFRCIYPYIKNANSFLVLLFIFDRTAAWGKEWEIITYTQFMEGVKNEKGELFSPSLRITKQTLANALKELVEGRFVFYKRDKGSRKGTAYAINYEWNPDMLNTDKREKEKEILSLENAILSAAKKTVDAKKKRELRCTTSGCFAYWEVVVKELYGNEALIGITVTDKAILFNYAKKWIEGTQKSFEEFKEYLKWCLERWEILREERFKWMKKSSPSHPVIRFFVRQHTMYEEAFFLKDKKVVKQEKKATEWKRRRTFPKVEESKAKIESMKYRSDEDKFDEWK